MNVGVGFGLTCLQFKHGSQSINLILSEQPSIRNRNVQLEPLVVGVETLVDVLRGKVFPS